MRPWLPVLLLILAAAPAAAQPTPTVAQPTPTVARPRVAVIVDLTANVSSERATELGRALADALERVLDVDTLGGGDVERRLPAGGVPDGCVAEPACIGDLGARLDASQLLLLAIVEIGGTTRIDSTWVAVATGEAVTRPRIELAADARAGEVFESAAPRLLPDAPHRPLADGGGGPTAPAGPRRHLTTATWVVGGAAVAAVAGGVGFGLSARAAYGRCDREPDSCGGATRDGIATRALVADVLIAGAVIGATTAAILYLRSAHRREAPPPTQAWLVTPTRHGALAELRVRF